MASSEKLQLQIVTPKGVVFAEDVEEVVAPGIDGEFGVLPGRLPMLAALHIGLVHYRKVGEDAMTDVAVGHGFAEVTGDKTLLLTDRFIAKGSIDILAVREKLKEVDEKLENWSGELEDPARAELVEEEQWLAAQLEVFGDPAVPRVLEYRRANDYSQLGLVPPAPEPMGEAHDGDPEGLIVDGTSADADAE
jgi:F-type H+-transporting ATPase subunit epsilon